MTRVFVLAAALAALSTPAFAAEVRVDLRAKDTVAVHQALSAAAWKACRKDYRGNALGHHFTNDCAKASLARAVKTVGTPALLAYHDAQPTRADARAYAGR